MFARAQGLHVAPWASMPCYATVMLASGGLMPDKALPSTLQFLATAEVICACSGGEPFLQLYLPSISMALIEDCREGRFSCSLPELMLPCHKPLDMQPQGRFSFQSCLQCAPSTISPFRRPQGER